MNMNQVAARINNVFGRTVCRMGNDPNLGLRRISTGILGLDIALGGGLPRARFIHFWGGESAGKNALIQRAIVELQRADPKAIAVLIDIEGTFDPVWAEIMGIDLARLIVLHPATGVEACRMAEEIIASDEADLVIMDSLGALAARAEMEGEIGDQTMGRTAALLSQFFRKTTAAMQLSAHVVEEGKKKIEHTRVCRAAVILINQVRARIGVYGNPEGFSGGWALKHFNSISSRIRRGDEIRGKPNSGILMDDSAKKETFDNKPKKISKRRGMGDKENAGAKKDPVVAHVVQIKPDKNKTSYKTPTMRTLLYLTDYGPFKAGEFDHVRDMLRLGTMFRQIDKSGGWYEFGEHRFQGISGFRQVLADNPDIYPVLYAAILKEAIGDAKFSEIDTSTFNRTPPKKGVSAVGKQKRGNDSPGDWGID